MEDTINNSSNMNEEEDKARREVTEIFDHKIDHSHRLQGAAENQDIARVLELCRQYPKLAVDYYTVSTYINSSSTPSKNIFTPLEYFMLRRLSNSVIQDFCESFPQALSVPTASNDNGWLPLHFACGRVAIAESPQYTRILILNLVEMHPKAVSTVDKDGNLPLHKLLRKYAHTPRRRHHHPHHETAANLGALKDLVVKEVEALVHIFPESTTTKGSDLEGVEPWRFVVSSRFPYDCTTPELIDCILTKVAKTKSITELVCPFTKFQNARQQLSIDYAKVFGAFFAKADSLERLVLTSAGLSSSIHTPDGWAYLFRNFSNCPHLKYLYIELPAKTMTQDEDALAAVVETLPQLKTLDTLILSFSSKSIDEQDRTKLLALSAPIAELLAQGNLVELIVKDGVDVDLDLEPILRAVINRPDSPLRTLDIRPCQKGMDMTQTLFDLISTNSRLDSLAFSSNICFQPNVIFRAFAPNTHLKSLRLPSIIARESPHGTCSTNTSSLSNVLQHYNATLERIHCIGASFADITGLENKRIVEYALLNRCGRARVRRERCGCTDVLNVLDCVLNSDSLSGHPIKRMSATYGILREAPSYWCVVPTNTSPTDSSESVS